MSTPRERTAQQTPSRSRVLAAPPSHSRTGPGPMDSILDVLLYATMGIGGAVLLMYCVRSFRRP